MSVCESVCLSVLTLVCLYQSVAMAEYAVYREVTDDLSAADVGVILREVVV